MFSCYVSFSEGRSWKHTVMQFHFLVSSQTLSTSVISLFLLLREKQGSKFKRKGRSLACHRFTFWGLLKQTDRVKNSMASIPRMFCLRSQELPVWVCSPCQGIISDQQEISKKYSLGLHIGVSMVSRLGVHALMLHQDHPEWGIETRPLRLRKEYLASLCNYWWWYSCHFTRLSLAELQWWHCMHLQ